MKTQRSLDSLGASELVYKVGGFRGSKPDADDLPPRLERLLERYNIVKPYADPGTGFKGIVLEEKNGSRRRIYAIAGVEFTKVDVSDFGAISKFAKPQLLGPQAKQFLSDAEEHARSSGDLMFAGQSMGGLVAQTMAYMVQSRLDEHVAGRVSLTTWGAVGGRELTDNLLGEQGKTFDPEVMREIDAVGFYVEGDWYTRIGTHMEPTRVLPRPNDVLPEDAHFIEKGILPSIEAAPSGLDSAVSKTPARNKGLTRILIRNLNAPSPMSEPMTMSRNEVEPALEPQTAEARQPGDARAETAGMLGDDMLVDPKDLSLDNEDRVRARLGFHAEEAERDPGARVKVAKCMQDCFVKELGFEGLSDGLDQQLGGIAATIGTDAALAVLRETVPEATITEPPRRRDQPRKRRIGPAPLDEAGRAAVQQAVLRLGAKSVQAGIARGAAKKAIDGIGGNVMMAKQLPGVFGTAFAPMGGAQRPLRAAVKAANAINEDAGIPDRADAAELTDRSGSRESATAVERAIQAAGSENFMAKLDEDAEFGFGGRGFSRAGRSLLDA